MTYRIHERNLDQLKQQIAKLARRAERLKLPAITITVGPHENITNPDNANELTRVYPVEVTGEAPRINGWKFTASIFHDEGGNVVRQGRGETVAPEAWTMKSGCDHCKVNRSRSVTFLLRNDDARTMQVGSTCLRDFLGHDCPQNVATWAEQMLSVSELCGAAENITWLGGRIGNGQRFVRMSLPVYLGHVAAQTLKFGFKGRKNVDASKGEKTTAQLAFDAMFPTQSACPTSTLIPSPEVPSEEAAKLAEEALTWVLRRFRADGDMEDTHDYDEFKLEAFHSPDAGLNEFQVSLLSVAKHEVISTGAVGLASWIVGAHVRNVEMLRLAAEEAKTSKHVGKVGERLKDLVLHYYDFKEWETSFGWQTLYKFKDAAGNQFTWKTSTAPCLEKGKTYTFTATIKEHNDFNGIPQTKLTRCKMTLKE